MSRVRLIETTVLLLGGILLAAATVNDVARQTHINHRLIADLRTWRAATGHDYQELSIDQSTLGERTEREVICGNTAPGEAKTTTQLCLEIWGAIVDGRRAVHGGWYLPPRETEDARAHRYGCFGAAAHGRCPSVRSSQNARAQSRAPASASDAAHRAGRRV